MNVVDILDSLKSGYCEIVSEIELYNILSSKRNLVIKVGFDPTTERLHLGHVVLLRKLRLFQDFGYMVSFLIGDFTAMIGDPSGRSNLRKQISRLDVVDNVKTYKDQIFKVLNPDFTKLYFNSLWLNYLSIDKIVDLMSSLTVSRLLERNDFKLRYSGGKAIFFHEFIYPLLQSYDSVFMNADIEFGGIDQKFNFLLSRNLQKKFHFKQQISIMVPILKGLDGKNKMSKSLGNCINIDDDFYLMFCKVMSIPDFLIREYFLYLGFLSLSEYDNLVAVESDFMVLKLDLAFRVVSLFYGDFFAKEAKVKFIDHFSKKNFFDTVEIRRFDIKLDFYYLSDFLVEYNFVISYSDFKRLLKQCSIKINQTVITDRHFILNVDIIYFLQVGKKFFLKILLKKT